MTERGQITIPKAIREKYGFSPHGEVEIRIKDGSVIVAPKREIKDFDNAVATWRGSATKRMRQLGFKSTDDFIEAIRGR